MSARDDEPFLQRWSRRKQRAREDAAPPVEPSAKSAAPPEPTAPQADTTEAPPQPKSLTEADFADVEWEKLDYTTDYGRFLAKGVPESIRQRALAKLWMSDPIFTQVDPFQDYAGDYTDAATVPKIALKTAYRVGQGFLSDEEAHAWDALGKPPPSAEIAALPVLRPGYRVRPATIADGTALLEVHRAAVLGPGSLALGEAATTLWARGLTIEGYNRAIAAGERIELAIEEASGRIAAFASCSGDRITALYVLPEHGRRRLATRLVERAHADMAARGHVFATVGATPAARPLCERLGYRVVGAPDEAAGDGLEVPVFDMVRALFTADEVTIDAETPDQPEVAAFFAASEAYMSALYPAESNHFAPVQALLAPNVLFLVARVRGRAIGCGAVVAAGDGSGEIKRMWVAPEARGVKLGNRLLAALEDAARDDGIAILRLETGIHQPEALALYRRTGFTDIAPFADYQPDPLSLFMEKRLVGAGDVSGR
jgi:putative acetyltransferase